MSVAAACCWSAERGHTSPCASCCNAEVCPPAVSLQPAMTTGIIGHQFTLYADDGVAWLHQTFDCRKSNPSTQTRCAQRHQQTLTVVTSGLHYTREAPDICMHPQSHLPNVFLSADIPVPYNLNIQWCLPCTAQCLCLSSLQPQLALSYQHTELPSHTCTHTHTQTHNRCTDPHECRESGFGVTFHCLSGSGPRPRWLAPPLMCYPTSPHTHSLLPISAPVVALQPLVQASDLEWNRGTRIPTV